MSTLAKRIEISTEPERLDVAMVHAFLSEAYWAKGRSYETVKRSIEHSLCFGAYLDGRQVGFGRVITDYAVFGYLADVFVLPEFRGKGVATALMGEIMAHPDIRGLRLFWLGTKDAHALYEKYGFTRLTDPGKFMAIFGPEPAPFP